MDKSELIQLLDNAANALLGYMSDKTTIAQVHEYADDVTHDARWRSNAADIRSAMADLPSFSYPDWSDLTTAQALKRVMGMYPR